jgi:hypothetical protein
VAESVPKLTPGLFAGAGHGFLRTAHAVRGLEFEDSPLRRRELAHGLGYWAARFQPLPGALGKGTASAMDGVASLSAWPLVGEAESRAGMFFESIRRLDSFPRFAAAIEELALPAPDEVDEFLSALCRAAAALYLDHPQMRLLYVHVLTIPSAARLVVGTLSEVDGSRLAAAVFQASAAMHSMFGALGALAEPAAEPDPEVERVSGSWDEIRYHAACSLQEHAIKMTEACWREDRIRTDPIFRAAAGDAALKIDMRGQAAEC